MLFRSRSETSTHNYQEEGIERGCEEEKKGFPVSIFPLLRFKIVRTFPNLVGFCSKALALCGKHGLTGLKFRPTVTEKRKLREVMRKRRKVPCDAPI